MGYIELNDSESFGEQSNKKQKTYPIFNKQ